MNIFLNKQTHIHTSINVIFPNDYSVSNCNDEANGGITQETIMIYASERLSSSGLIGDDGKFTAPIAGAYEFKIYTRTVSNRVLSRFFDPVGHETTYASKVE